MEVYVIRVVESDHDYYREGYLGKDENGLLYVTYDYDKLSDKKVLKFIRRQNAVTALKEAQDQVARMLASADDHYSSYGVDFYLKRLNVSEKVMREWLIDKGLM